MAGRRRKIMSVDLFEALVAGTQSAAVAVATNMLQARISLSRTTQMEQRQ